MDALLEPHHQATIDRMRRESVVLVAQDTSSLNYTMHSEMQGIGPISNRVKGPQGLLVHSALAFCPDGLPLGLLDIECWARDPSEFGKKKLRHSKQPARTAEMSVHFGEVTLSPPQDKRHLAPIRMWVVFTREELPPKEVKEPLEWMLLTTVPVTGLVDALERVQWYARRWGIEVFHRILKSGCQIEDRQLGTADRLEACLAIDAVVAWRIHYLTWLGRATPDLPCTVAFEEDQWKAVIVFKTRKPPPEQPPSLRQMIRSIAQLGGFLARKADGEPGTQTLWRGLQRMDDVTAAFRSFRTAYAMPP